MKLRLAIDLTRHGDRAPVMHMHNLTDGWPEARIGHLTALGLANSMKLGEKLRSYYVDQTHLLPDQYKEGSMMVRSTKYQRTSETAAQILKGLYPQDWQKINVVTVETAQDDLLLQYHTSMDSIRREYFFYQMPQEDQEAVDRLIKKLSKIVGVELEPSKLMTVGDALKVSRVHSIPINSELSAVEVDEVIRITAATWVRRFAVPAVQNLVASNFLRYLVQVFSEELRGDRSTSYELYVAHDYNIAALVFALTGSLRQIPPYNSILSFRLFEDGGNEVVSVFYEDLPLLIDNIERRTVSEFVLMLQAKIHKIQNS